MVPRSTPKIVFPPVRRILKFFSVPQTDHLSRTLDFLHFRGISLATVSAKLPSAKSRPRGFRTVHDLVQSPTRLARAERARDRARKRRVRGHCHATPKSLARAGILVAPLATSRTVRVRRCEEAPGCTHRKSNLENDFRKRSGAPESRAPYCRCWPKYFL